MNNIIKFPHNRWTPKPKTFYKFVSPAKYFAIFIAVTAVVGILTAAVGPAAFILMAVILMFYTRSEEHTSELQSH